MNSLRIARRPTVLRFVRLLLLLLSAALMTGCQTARYVVKQPERGVVAIPSDGQNFPRDYRDQAALLMAQHFPEGYRLTGEELVRSGPDRTYHENLDQVSEQTGPLHILGRSTIGYGFQRDRQEIHISYEALADDTSEEPAIDGAPEQGRAVPEGNN